MSRHRLINGDFRERFTKRAFLVVICDPDTNAVLSARIWSSPEWEQSQFLDQRTYVAYQVGGPTFADASAEIVTTIQSPRSRYHWLLPYLQPREQQNDTNNN